MKTLTEKEKNFAELYVENIFSNQTLTNRDIAIAAGYAKESAHQRAYENTTYRLKPHVVNHIEMLKEDFRARNQITPEKHMARLNELHEMAKAKGQLHTAMNAEVYRGKMAGYYVERQLVKRDDDLTHLTEDQLDERMKKIREQWGILKGETDEE
jgi:signal transduction protein with GAF and PtsI domain